MANDTRSWPKGLVAYKRTPEFTEKTVPAGLLRAHSTKADVWAKIHVLSGSLVFRDLADGTKHVLPVGVHAIIYPEKEHEVAVHESTRFFVEFHRYTEVTNPSDPMA